MIANGAEKFKVQVTVVSAREKIFVFEHQNLLSLPCFSPLSLPLSFPSLCVSSPCSWSDTYIVSSTFASSSCTFKRWWMYARVWCVHVKQWHPSRTARVSSWYCLSRRLIFKISRIFCKQKKNEPQSVSKSNAKNTIQRNERNKWTNGIPSWAAAGAGVAGGWRENTRAWPHSVIRLG